MPSDALRVTWVGHATALIDTGSARFVTDPLLTRRVAHLRRRRPLPDPDTADVDAVLLSHAHLDHLHRPSLRRVRSDAKVLTPRGTAQLVRSAGFSDVTEVAPGDHVQVAGATIEVVRAAHSSKRGPHSRVEARPVGYVVDAGRRVYFPGDTDLFDEMADLATIDVALLPIWGWGSTLGTGHLDPSRAARAVELIEPRLVLPIHWGTYAPEDGRRRLPKWFEAPPTEFEAAATDLGVGDRIRIVEPGGNVIVS
jgi:L-ascorbate metabolism protein UlaG (beta-lactamase superfamily)